MSLRFVDEAYHHFLVNCAFLDPAFGLGSYLSWVLQSEFRVSYFESI